MNSTQENGNFKEQVSSDDSSSQFMPRIVHFSELAKGAKEVVVEHDEQLYRLRLTKNGKLILNK